MKKAVQADASAVCQVLQWVSEVKVVHAQHRKFEKDSDIKTINPLLPCSRSESSLILPLVIFAGFMLCNLILLFST